MIGACMAKAQGAAMKQHTQNIVRAILHQGAPPTPSAAGKPVDREGSQSAQPNQHIERVSIADVYTLLDTSTSGLMEASVALQRQRLSSMR
jgi:hypothetical protein